MILSQELLVNAIIGKGFNSIEATVHYTNLGFAEFTGNSWNEDWEWDRKELNMLSVEQLKGIYNNLESPSL